VASDVNLEVTMRSWLVGVAAVSMMAACGGGGGGSSEGAVSGTIGGQAFTPTETRAVIAGPSNCTVQSTPVNVKAFALRFASFTGVCTALASDPLCELTHSAQTVSVVFADVGVGGVSPTLGAGTFTLTSDPTSLTGAEAHTNPSDPLVGTLSIAFGGAVVTGASCQMATAPQAAQGTLTVKSVTASEITGSVDLTFGTGTDMLKGDFAAALCSPITDVCPLAETGGTCSGTPTCD